jgi:predicted RNA binding protein YcfA (HicA-like mRNA interferase family)
MRSAEVIKLIKKAGWSEVRQSGSHKQFRHPTLPGTVTVPHPKIRDGDRNVEEHRNPKRGEAQVSLTPS